MPNRARPDTDGARRVAGGLLAAGLFLLPLVYWRGLSAPDLLPKRVLVYAVVLGLGLTWLFARRPRRLPLLTLPAFAYGLWALLSAFWSGSPFSCLVEGMQLTVCILLFAAVQVLLRPDDVLVGARAAAAGGLILAAIGIGQYLGFAPLRIPSVGLPSGTFVFRNLAASCVIGLLPLAVLAAITDSRNGTRLVWVAAVGAMAVFLVYTRTRGAWLGAAASVAVAAGAVAWFRGLREALARACRAAWSRGGSRVGLAATVCICAGAVFLPDRTRPGVIQRFDEQKPSASAAVQSVFTPGSDRGRLDMWRHTLEMAWDHPILGVGLDNWEYVYPLYDTGQTPGKITSASEPVRPHNDFLWILSELGVVGLVLYLWLLTAAWLAAVKAFRAGPAVERLCALAGMAGLVALLGHSLFSFPKEQPATAALFWIHLGILGVATPREAGRHQMSTWARLSAALVVAVCVAGLTLAWRHVRFDRSYNLARALESRAEWGPAAEAMASAIEQGDFDHRARFLRARYLQHTGRLPEAESAYRSALVVHPNYAHSLHNLGGVLAAQGKWQEAIAAYRNALAVRPGYEDARMNLGYALAAAGQLPEAEAEFQAVARENPSSAAAYGNLGAVYLQAGRADRAIPLLRKAVQLQVDYAQAYNNLGYALEATGKIEAAIQTYTRLLDLWSGERRQRIASHIASLQTRLTDRN